MILVNGQQQDHLAVRDRAIHYGDGLFETIAVDEGRPLALDRHLRRLQQGCDRLGIECPNPVMIKREAGQVCEDRKRAVLKIIISRGEGGRGYTPTANSQTTRIISCYDWPVYPPEYTHQGITAAVSGIRLGINPLLAGMKHLNRLEQVLLRGELSTLALPEAVVMDIEDRVIEGTMSNIFLVKDGLLKTPGLECSGVQGIIREAVLELSAQNNIQSQITTLHMDEVFEADEVFFCNSIAGIWPVTAIQHVIYQVGKITAELQQLLARQNLIVIE